MGNWITNNKGAGPWSFSKGVWSANQGPWSFDKQTNRLKYNEGSYISEYGNNTWPTEEFSGNRITDTHDPCGYWESHPTSPGGGLVYGWNVPKMGYLVGWYKFDEGTGDTAYNSVVTSGGGGGAWENLYVENNRGDFWTRAEGFASNPVRDDPQNYAWCYLPGRTFGTPMSIGMFLRIDPVIPVELGAGVPIHIGLAEGAYIEFYHGISNDGSGIIESRMTKGSTCTIGTISNCNKEWLFFFTNFSDTAVDSMVHACRRWDETNLSGTPAIAFGAQIAGDIYLSIGCQYYGIASAFGGRCTWGDVIIYNNIRLSYSEWLQWYNQLKSRYEE